jgi:lipopolysaccharide export system protein LptA
MATGSRRGGWRGISVARLRLWLAIGVVGLVVVLAGLLGYARYRARRLLTDLPHRLGIDIKSETNGFTWSQSVKGHTLRCSASTQPRQFSAKTARPPCTM